MANELSVSMSFAYARGNFAPLARALTALGVTISSDPVICDVLNVTTVELAVPLGGVVLAGNWAWFRNLDSTNFLEIRVATGGTKFLKLKPGEAALLRLGSGVTAPFAIADTATCALEYVLFSG